MKDRVAKNLVVKLIEETSRRQLRWEVEDVPRSIEEGSNNIVPIFLETRFQGQRVALYQIKFKHFIDDVDYFWDAALCLSVLDEAGRTLWSYEGNDLALNELFSDARRYLPGVDDFLSQFR